jgi:NodT family efflux transporter outer membrane factor (OMF) lipoprotein
MKTFRLTAIAATLALSACITAPNTGPLQRPLAETDLGLAAEVSAPLPKQDWWAAFGDAQLDRLMQGALANNPGLMQAMARVREARALADVTRAGQYPSVSYDAQETRQRFSRDSEIPPPFAGGTYWQGTQGLDLSWDLDFWGHQSSLLKQARSQTAADALDAASARLALSGAVTQAYVDLYRNHALADVAQRTLEQRQRILEITRKRLGVGLDTNIELRQAESAVPQAQLELMQAQAAVELDIHQLAALSGHGADVYPAIERPQLDPAAALPLPSALPADLLGRRPDIVAARDRVEAATAGQAAAKAAFYPDVNLSVFAATSAVGLGNLFKAESGSYGAGPALHLPLFDAGRLKAEYRSAAAEIDGAVDGYNAAVLHAVQQTSDQLSLIRALDAELAEQQESLDDAEAAYRLAEERYRNGLTSYLTVLSTETQVLGARRGQVELISAQAIARINLLLAVGGSFDPNAPLPL